MKNKQKVNDFHRFIYNFIFYYVHCLMLLNLYIGDGDDVMMINDEEIDLSKFGDGDCDSTSSSSCDEFNGDLSLVNLQVGNESDGDDC